MCPSCKTPHMLVKLIHNILTHFYFLQTDFKKRNCELFQHRPDRRYTYELKLPHVCNFTVTIFPIFCCQMKVAVGSPLWKKGTSALLSFIRDSVEMTTVASRESFKIWSNIYQPKRDFLQELPFYHAGLMLVSMIMYSMCTVSPIPQCHPLVKYRTWDFPDKKYNSSVHVWQTEDSSMTPIWLLTVSLQKHDHYHAASVLLGRCPNILHTVWL